MSDNGVSSAYRFKHKIDILLRDNSNQDAWIRTVRINARSIGASLFLLKMHNTSRGIAAADMTAHGPLKPGVKAQPAMPGVKLEVQEDDEAVEAAHDGHFEPQYEDLDALDDYEHKLFEGMVIFTQPDGSDEPSAVTTLRFVLSDNLLNSVPHHKHKLTTWTEGNIYELIKLVTQAIRLTARARYNALMQLGAVKFPAGKGIDDLINDLHAVQVSANRLNDRSIDEEVLTGALLTLTGSHPRFSRLSQDFSRTDCTLTYLEMCSEFRNVEDLAPLRSASQTLFHLDTHSHPAPTGHFGQGQFLNEEQMFAAFSKWKGTQKTPSEQAKETCNNYLAGRCTFGDKCKRIHPAGKEGSKPRSKDKDKRPDSGTIRCYNCQRDGVKPFHIAKDCPFPKKERALATTEEKVSRPIAEGETTLKDFLRSLVKNPTRAHLHMMRSHKGVYTRRPTHAHAGERIGEASNPGPPESKKCSEPIISNLPRPPALAAARSMREMALSVEVAHSMVRIAGLTPAEVQANKTRVFNKNTTTKSPLALRLWTMVRVWLKMHRWHLHQASLGHLEAFFAPSGLLRMRQSTRAPDADVTSTGNLVSSEVREQVTKVKGNSASNVAAYFSPQASAAIALAANSSLRADAEPFVFTRNPTSAKLPPATPRKPKQLKRQRSPARVTTCLVHQLELVGETKYQAAMRNRVQREQRAINNRARFLNKDPRTVTLQEVQNSSARVSGWHDYDSGVDDGGANDNVHGEDNSDDDDDWYKLSDDAKHFLGQSQSPPLPKKAAAIDLLSGPVKDGMQRVPPFQQESQSQGNNSVRQHQASALTVREHSEYVFLTKPPLTDYPHTMLVDSGASSHCALARNAGLVDPAVPYVRTDDPTYITTADTSTEPMSSMGRIDAVASLGNGKNMRLGNTMLLDDRLSQQLMSVGAATDQGYHFVFSGDSCHIFDDQWVLLKRIAKSGNLYATPLLPPGNNHETANMLRELENFTNLLEAPECSLPTNLKLRDSLDDSQGLIRDSFGSFSTAEALNCSNTTTRSRCPANTAPTITSTYWCQIPVPFRCSWMISLTRISLPSNAHPTLFCLMDTSKFTLLALSSAMEISLCTST
jgi:hypothetical protein